MSFKWCDKCRTMDCRCRDFTSCARWPTTVYAGQVSRDHHRTESAAMAVCRRLEKEGWGGEGEVFPLETWVEWHSKRIGEDPTEQPERETK